MALDDEKSIQLIARGNYKRVAWLIAEIEYPTSPSCKLAVPVTAARSMGLHPPRAGPLRPPRPLGDSDSHSHTLRTLRIGFEVAFACDSI
jgi:hypothetical protein